MNEKFAILNLYDTLDDIKIENKVISKLNAFFKKKYLSYKNPYKIKELDFFDVNGYNVNLALSFDDLDDDKRFFKVFDKTISDLKNMGVDIFECNAFDSPIDLNLLDTNCIFSFFLIEAIKKALEENSQKLKTAEILIIDSGSYLTDLVLENVYPFVNYLSILTDDFDYYDKKAIDIYNNYGLNLNVVDSYSSIFVKNAELIINLAGDEQFNAFKRSAIYFNLRKKKSLISMKRKDIILFESINLRINNQFLSLDTLGMVLELKLTEYQNIVSNNYTNDDLVFVRNFIKEKNIHIAKVF